jgi:4'-phosphopantetheinyl transferase
LTFISNITENLTSIISPYYKKLQINLDWHVPSKFPDILKGELHLWKAQLSQVIGVNQGILSADELSRMRRYRFEKDRMMFLFARTLLRQLLGAYLRLNPEQVEFHYTNFGKPYLASTDQRQQFEFNLSHSGEIVLIAVTPDAPIGVDVEKIHDLPNLDLIAARFFSYGEQLDLNKLSGQEKVSAFYHCWTRKESVIKACGEGLSLPLDSFQVSLLPGEQIQVKHSPDLRPWFLHNVIINPGYAAAVAVPVDCLMVRYFSADGIQINRSIS